MLAVLSYFSEVCFFLTVLGPMMLGIRMARTVFGECLQTRNCFGGASFALRFTIHVIGRQLSTQKHWVLWVFFEDRGVFKVKAQVSAKKELQDPTAKPS